MNKVILAVAASLLLMACGGGNPTVQYVVNLDKKPSIQKGAGQCDAANPTRATTTFSGLDEDQVLSLFEEKDGTAYAELAYGPVGAVAKHIFTGKKNGDAYALQDNASSDDTNQQNAEQIVSDIYTLNLKKDGNFITGSVTLQHHEGCNGNSCNTPTVDCSYSSNLTGRKLPLNGTDAPRAPPGGK